MDDKDREFDINLAKIGMRYGAFMAITAALFALGAEELLRYDLLSGCILLASGVVITVVCTKRTKKETEELKKKIL